MPAGRDFLRDIEAQGKAFERTFFEWIESYNGEGDLDILEAFGETMLALDSFVDCRWGCDDDHPEKHLLAIFVTRVRAMLLLIACGYPSEAGALFRPLGETVNLMALLVASRDELDVYRHGSRKQRRKKFSAKKVRGKLKLKHSPTPQSSRTYGTLSDFYLHPNALDHVFGHRTSHEGKKSFIPYFHRDLCISMFMTLTVSTITALLFWACTQDDDNDFRLACAFREKTDKALRSFTAKMAQDPTVERAPMVEAPQRA